MNAVPIMLRRHLLAVAILVVAHPGFAVASNGAQASATSSTMTPAIAQPSPVNAAASSCQALKSNLKDAGMLQIVSGPRGWGDTYYATTPRCQFWQMASYSYVVARDGWCGVGSVCANRITK